MGTWGGRLFQDDTALDIREEFLDLLRNRVDPADAARVMEERNQSIIEDPDEVALFWMSLAATQWEYGCLTDHVRERALAVIAAGADLHRWEQPRGRKQRAAMCEALAVKLRSEQPRRRTPRARRQLESTSTTVVAPDGVTSATVFSIPGVPNRMQVLASMLVNGFRGGGSVCVGGADYTAITLEWLDNRTLRITHPAAMNFECRDKTHYFFGEEIEVCYQPATD